MLSIALILFIIGAVVLYSTYKFNRSIKTDNKQSTFMIEESQRILLDNAKVDADYTSSGRVYTRGLSLIKNKETDKYDLISQAKVCDIGLY